MILFIFFLFGISSINSFQLVMKRDRYFDNLNYESTSGHIPKTTNQYNYVNYLDNTDIKLLFVDGPAGSGKTLFACQKSVDLLKKKIISKIIITRPLVSVDEEIGFLPGNLIKKMDPWIKPIVDLFNDFYSATEIDFMIKNNIIEICPLAFMRGRTFKNCFIIADEMQNCTPKQMQMLTTRLGSNCKMVVIGDGIQSDLSGKNGFNDFIYKFEKYNSLNKDKTIIKVIKFDKNDIQRSLVTKQVLNVYNFSGHLAINPSHF